MQLTCYWRMFAFWFVRAFCQELFPPPHFGKPCHRWQCCLQYLRHLPPPHLCESAFGGTVVVRTLQIHTNILWSPWFQSVHIKKNACNICWISLFSPNLWEVSSSIWWLHLSLNVVVSDICIYLNLFYFCYKIIFFFYILDRTFFWNHVRWVVLCLYFQ